MTVRGIHRHSFNARDETHVIWDTILTAFVASNDWEWEVVGAPDGMVVEGQTCVQIPLSVNRIVDYLKRSVSRNDLKEVVRVRMSRKRGGHVWLQKVGAETHPELLESEKIAPMWTKYDKQKAKAERKAKRRTKETDAKL